ncbi:36a21a7e-9dcb-4a29-a429-1d4e891c8f6f [Thermothielavioides terrestris]|jgi:hypothetical protein|uniref:Uncharacterized protein n=2 Tax=Thermothielavioides terrestris TaxID=2587410 RepID=G2QZI7_THETT|nr:uncharacterized protein THITE_152995 [Thermothielavioides terrestris NRRL 8126]AEO65513.1 hypothetical protein THITE_152995 [Thermothielavioides terrestris NRRL 8126]SPQ19234.1 36a21a7e-9dcb-4a29-a429-1d4e891c8f6f [Thermothielavioides terrestris]
MALRELIKALEKLESGTAGFDAVDEQHAARKAQDARLVLERLEGSRDNGHTRNRTHYRDVFARSDGSHFVMGRLVMEVDKAQEGQGLLRDSHMVFPASFESQLYYLPFVLLGRAPKRIVDDAWVDVYPRRPIIPGWFNTGLIFVAGFLYCAARLTIIGVAFSCLRSMPDSVYVQTWAKNIPSFQ